jgi:hypothetical protein
MLDERHARARSFVTARCHVGSAADAAGAGKFGRAARRLAGSGHHRERNAGGLRRAGARL